MKQLDTWNDLNDCLKEADEGLCNKLIQAERAGKARPTFIKRIHSRLNKARAERERAELLKPVRKIKK